MEIKNNLIGGHSTLWQSRFGAILYGVIWALIVTFVLSFFTSIILYYSPLSETYLYPASIVIIVISIFFGAYLTAQKSQTNGLIKGVVVGVCVFIILLLLSYLFGGFFLNGLLLKLVYCVVAGAIGGIFGIK